MAPKTRTPRIAHMVTPLPPETLRNGEVVEALLFAQLKGRDHVSACFEFDVLAQSFDPNIKAEDLLGEMITVALPTHLLDEGAPRFFHGMVDQFRFEGNDDSDMFDYRLTLRPALWLLSKSTDNRIFQDMSVKDIVSKILDEHGVSDYRFDVQGTALDVREYCVQYGETDLDFVQRLLEHEGAFYFFEFEEDKHTLVITDDVKACKPGSVDGTIRFEPNDIATTDGVGVVTRFRRHDTIATATHTLTDYNFEAPSADLLSKSIQPEAHTGDTRERYSYPGHFMDAGAGSGVAVVRIDEDRARRRQMVARSTAAGFWSGHLLTLEDHPRDEENREYLVVSVAYDVLDGQYSAGTDFDREEGVLTTLELVPEDSAFRPARRTPKPVMRGPQTARVVGPAGEEIYTDQYSRVKVHFFWDRLGAGDETSTCWIRVSSAWAGAGFGFIQIPRIGQEVIVDFLDGDPDRPIITGRVYNAEQMPPYELPGNATQSGWKSESSLGGGGWNELRFEDLKGSEEVYFQAEKDHNELVKNNETRHIGNDFAEEVVNNATQDIGVNRDETVGNNKTTDVGVNRTVSIGNNDTETVGVDRSLTVGANETIGIGANSTETIGANHTQSVGANQTITVSVARVDTVGAAETRTVGAAQINSVGAVRQMTVGASQSHEIAISDSWSIGAGQSVTIGADQSVNVGANHTFAVAEDSTTNVGKNMSTSVGEDKTVDVGKNLQVTAADSITFTCGKASIQMKKDGTIVLEGKDISITGKGKIVAKASGDMTLKGSKINQN
ncbi:type VI secretion system tip protein TssI/VgrG [Pseudosulfitobacter sp. DSM 107133]|uniref:type VI secretion system Vgr family protein n=1 Tax=Pseudosulfitobacter sp. DSM 107133 TaxID=2883100 RepID=UPI001F084EE6|nr:type VI secretion system tip protein TssI/VgrG [Pseudosulfitobacter sp. DSM 107133]UOA28984.1 Actin cross-linking toxin VgrG1 [Pseudosulfitobacter sp. DSM 107133]